MTKNPPNVPIVELKSEVAKKKAHHWSDKIKKILRKIWPKKVIRRPKSRLKVEALIRLELPRPPRQIFFAISLIFFLYIIAGGIYNLTRDTIFLNFEKIGDTIIPVFIWEDLHEQYIIEGMIFAILVGIAFVGTCLIHESTKHFYRPETSYTFVVVGLIMFFLSFAMIEIMIHQKVSTFYSVVY